MPFRRKARRSSFTNIPSCPGTSLDFREEEQVARLRKLWESLELGILSVLEAGNRLRESAISSWMR